MPNPSARLCVFCRRFEQTDQPCPREASKPSKPNTFESVTLLLSEDQDLVEHLQKQPNRLCTRCSEYDLLGAFIHAQPRAVDSNRNNEEFLAIEAQINPYSILLGDLSAFLLTPSCQLCRLIYHILPRGISLDHGL